MLQRFVNAIGFLAKTAGIAIIVGGLMISAACLLLAMWMGSRDFIIAYLICAVVPLLWLVIVFVPPLKNRFLLSDAEGTWTLFVMMIVGVYLSIAASGILALLRAGELVVLIVAMMTVIIPTSYLVLDKLGLTWFFDGIHLPDLGDD